MNESKNLRIKKLKKEIRHFESLLEKRKFENISEEQIKRNIEIFKEQLKEISLKTKLWQN